MSVGSPPPTLPHDHQRDIFSTGKAGVRFVEEVDSGETGDREHGKEVGILS